jgi:hypothetical protein
MSNNALKTFKEDCLIIGFDWNFNKDVATLMVTRKEGEVLKVLNSFHNDEAVELYHKLVRRD